MRLIFIILGWIFLIYPVLVFGQSIFAGQSSGTNIVYHDIDDLHIDSPYWNSSDYEYMDLNDDGIIDLRLLTSFTYDSHVNSMSSRAAADAADNCQYSTLYDHTYWIRKHGYGDLVDGSLNWYVEQGPYYGGLFYALYNSKGTDGVFTGDGYMTFRICKTDTTYGWIRIYSNVSFDGAYLTVSEYAYKSTASGTSFESENSARPLFYINKDQFIVEIPQAIYYSSSLLSCYDLSGRLIFQMRPEPGMNYYNNPPFHKGLYIIHFTDGKGHFFFSRLFAF